MLAPVDPTAFGFKDQAEMEKAYVPGSLDPFKGPDGKVYGIPFEYNSWPMVINDRIFKEAGLDPEKDYPKTWEEVGTIGAKLAKVQDGRFERQGVCLEPADLGWTMLLYRRWFTSSAVDLSDDDKGKGVSRINRKA
jgi:multiple sugar transport system substrate-binding protein